MKDFSPSGKEIFFDEYEAKEAPFAGADRAEDAQRRQRLGCGVAVVGRARQRFGFELPKADDKRFGHWANQAVTATRFSVGHPFDFRRRRSLPRIRLVR
jgi:hypothetical protein